MSETDDLSTVEPWMESVASVLRRPHRSAPAFTLGEAVEEIALWSEFARPESWNNSVNQASLNGELLTLRESPGPRLAFIVDEMTTAVRDAPDRAAKLALANELLETWRSPDSIRAAFQDLCDEARRPKVTTWDLRPLAEILASQLREGASVNWGLLHDAASELTGSPDRRFRGHAATTPPAQSAAERVQRAEDCLLEGRLTGRVIIWLAYRRAAIGWRLDIGPVSFLRADWFVPNARSAPVRDFAERDELRLLLEDAVWLEDIELEIEDAENRVVLVRVDLGYRAVGGAVQKAKRGVEALINIAVGAGGVSWDSAECSATVVDGKVVSSSIGTSRSDRQQPGDTYGVGVTGEILETVAKELGDALQRESMPDYLIEALSALREAGMTDHRDVLFYVERAVTPRVATALEDHATELIVSFASSSSKTFVAALDAREADFQFEKRLLQAVMAPFDLPPRTNSDEPRRSLERVVSRYSGGRRVVSIGRVIEHSAELLKLPMPTLMKHDLELALQAFQDAELEASIRSAVETEARNLRDRYRRVRNSIAHGNPLGDHALASTRSFSARRADTALGIALHAYGEGKAVSALLTAESANRDSDRFRMSAGESYADRQGTD